MDNNTPATSTAEKAFTLDDIQRVYFGPEHLAEAAEMLGKIQTVLDADKISYNMDLNEETPPDGYGINVVPVRQRNEATKTNELIGVAFHAIPSFELVMADEKGSDFVREAMLAAFSAKQANAIRPTRDGTTSKAPFSLQDFIERKSRDGGFKTWNELKKLLVQAMKIAGLKTMNAAILRQCLSNAAIAESQCPSVPQEQWGKVLAFAEHAAIKRNLDPSIFQNWAATRDDASMAEDKFDMSKLDEMFNDSDEDEGEAAA